MVHPPPSFAHLWVPEPKSSQVAVLTQALGKWEQVRLQDNVYDGMATVAAVFCDAMTSVADVCGTVDLAVQNECLIVKNRFEVCGTDRAPRTTARCSPDANGTSGGCWSGLASCVRDSCRSSAV